MAVSYICRLCFANEDSSEDIEFVDIHRFEPFLTELAGTEIASGEDSPQRVCSTCEFQLEATLLLRKRVQFTKNVWMKYEAQKDSLYLNEEINCDKDLFLCCHLCGQSFDFDALEAHVATEHGEDHLKSCGLCSVMYGTNFVEYDEPEHEMMASSISIDMDPEDTGLDLKTSNKNVNDVVRLEELRYLTSEGVCRYQCSKCDRTYSGPNRLRQHVLRVHPGLSLLFKACRRKVSGKTSSEIRKRKSNVFGSNTRNAKGETEVRYVCPKCPHSFQRSNKLRDHMQMKHQIELPFAKDGGSANIRLDDSTQDNTAPDGERILKWPKKYCCTECSKCFCRSNLLRDHMQKKHNIELPFARDRAGEIIKVDVDSPDQLGESTQDNTIPDNNRILKWPKVYGCTECSKSFSRSNKLRDHLKKKHDIELPFARDRGSANIRVDSPEHDYTNTIPGRILKRPKVFGCTECSKSFSRTNLLRDHLLIAHDIMMPYKYKKFQDTLLLSLQPTAALGYKSLYNINE